MMLCIFCHTETSDTLVCDDCKLHAPTSAFPAQIPRRPQSFSPDEDHLWLMDCFGAFHGLSAPTNEPSTFTIGREPTCTISISDMRISRSHATITHASSGSAWLLCDARSRNGTSVNGTAARTEVALSHRDLVVVADFPFRCALLSESDGITFSTVLGNDQGSGRETMTMANDKLLSLSNAEGSGGFASVGTMNPLKHNSVTIPLSDLELDLLLVLAHARRRMDNFDTQARGWMQSQELLDLLTFATKAPTSNNLRGVIKRVREKFDRVSMPDPIESRQNFGYRISPHYQINRT